MGKGPVESWQLWSDYLFGVVDGRPAVAAPGHSTLPGVGYWPC